jgi:hypothetical protein
MIKSDFLILGLILPDLIMSSYFFVNLFVSGVFDTFYNKSLLAVEAVEVLYCLAISGHFRIIVLNCSLRNWSKL